MDQQYDIDGRYVKLKIKINNEIFNIINIYAPTDSREQIYFIDNIYSLFNKLNEQNILAGDFNAIINTKTDTSNNKRTTLKSHEHEWQQLYKTLNLVDTNKDYATANNFNIHYTTWNNKNISTRIDRIYYTNNSNLNIIYDSTLLFPNSDHKMVIAKLSTTNKQKVNNIKKDRWILNDSILDDRIIDSQIRIICDNHFRKDASYDNFIEIMQKTLKREAYKKHQENFDMYLQLQKEYQSINDKFDNDNLLRKSEIKQEINNYFNNKLNGLKKRSKMQHIEFIKNPTKVFIKDQIQRGKQNYIDSIYHNGEIINVDKQIIKLFEDYYKNIYQNDTFIDENCKFNIKPIDDESNKILDQPFTYDEFYDAICKLRDVAPGKNGLTLI